MEVLEHHVKTEPCSTRPAYREGKTPKNVKVYSCVHESKYLIVTRVPSLNLDTKLVKLFETYGTLGEHRPLHDYPCDQFFEAHLVKFVKIQHARVAKIKLDDYNFYGSLLHVFYAPEWESVEDLREKISERKYIVSVKCEKYEQIGFGTPDYEEKSRAYFKGLKEKKKTSCQSSSKVVKVNAKESNLVKEENPMVKFPELPEGWVKPTITGDASYDETVKEISNQLKRTIPHQQEVVFSRKRKKILRL